MGPYIIAIDLGTTNFKFALYDKNINLVALEKLPVLYLQNSSFVEFDVEDYFDRCLTGISLVIKKGKIDSNEVALISLTGQAESFVITDENGKLLYPGISWKDNRSIEEVEIIKEHVGPQWYNITGLPEVSTTWPLTKLLWLKRNEPKIFNKIAKVFLIKDYITYSLCGEHVSEYTVFSFSGLMNLTKREIWSEMVTYLDLKDEMFGRLEEAGEVVGTLKKELAAKLQIPESTQICIGALDHVSGMVGTGNLKQGKVSVSFGTVNALALNISSFEKEGNYIECHSGYYSNSVIQLLVIESGGIALQWFHDEFIPDLSFSEIDDEVAKTLDKPNEIIFLPYVCGLNPPEYNDKAKGVFYGFDVGASRVDFARSVLESNGFLLRKSIEYLESLTEVITEIHAIGGSSGSPLFCQMVADIIKKPVITFQEPESATLGVALMGSVALKMFTSIEEAVASTVKYSAVYKPMKNQYYEEKYDKFKALYEKLFPQQKGGV